jgi:hypothetical protein
MKMALRRAASVSPYSSTPVTGIEDVEDVRPRSDERLDQLAVAMLRTFHQGTVEKPIANS